MDGGKERYDEVDHEVQEARIPSQREGYKQIMPAETFTRTTQDVADRVKVSFGDTSGSQITDTMIVRWINDGQQEIVNNNAILKDTKYANIVAEQSDYTFPNDRVQYIEALYVDGRPIKNATPQEFRDFILKEDPELIARADIPLVWQERAGIITFYPTPQKSFANGLKMEYVKQPVSISSINSSTLLSIPDRYLNELVSYVMAQALEMDENYNAAQLKRGEFREGLDRQYLRENTSQISKYPQVLADPDDYLV
jgi:hypothetical protein